MRRLLPLVLLALLPVAGCDTADGGTVFLSPRDVSFSFQVDGSGLTAGQSATVNAVSAVSMQNNLDGFSLSEIVAARVTAARIRRVSPLGSGNTLGDLMQSAQVSVSGGATQQVASGSGFGTATQATLTTSGNDVSGIVKGQQFSGRLQFVPAKASDAIYEVTLTLAIEVEGL